MGVSHCIPFTYQESVSYNVGNSPSPLDNLLELNSLSQLDVTNLNLDFAPLDLSNALSYKQVLQLSEQQSNQQNVVEFVEEKFNSNENDQSDLTRSNIAENLYQINQMNIFNNYQNKVEISQEEKQEDNKKSNNNNLVIPSSDDKQLNETDGNYESIDNNGNNETNEFIENPKFFISLISNSVKLVDHLIYGKDQKTNVYNNYDYTYNHDEHNQFTDNRQSGDINIINNYNDVDDDDVDDDFYDDDDDDFYDDDDDDFYDDDYDDDDLFDEEYYDDDFFNSYFDFN